ncbi:MAG: 1,3-beta-galactosyl-N-acetylhexosamine phosphorylase [Oscillospiraceae bacterium]|nr:1,3-beta-galactosyl-N-acetylhexosamine phosphorylase [Oscillospiraceae bacterium]
MTAKPTGGFTLPGEAGHEALTLKLAKKWGADIIRDSDGTTLSPEITKSGYGIYSTVCIIREHNDWLKQHPKMQQQTFLITSPAVADADVLEISLLDDFFDQHAAVNETPESQEHWQVVDRTTGQILPRKSWRYEAGTVVLEKPALWHTYTVSFLAFRIWEEISMYNHTTNNWDSEHLMQVDPVYEQARKYLLAWMEQWCLAHPETTVARFTSLFYNFTWIWGSHSENRNLFVDWGSYAFAVSPLMLENFQKAYGYCLTAEDFVNGGKYRTTHMPPDSRLRDWIGFICDFVADFAKQLVDVVHRHGKQAYIFYDDSWIGLEPYGPRFSSIGFDGIIKCVFSGFESRMCSGVAQVKTHELRLHPYLFPVGLGGATTFAAGGNPAREAMEYWAAVRRAMLRAPIERIGLGGYLHLVEPFPEFVENIAKIADEFRIIRNLHAQGAPLNLKPVVGILTAWGSLRSWTCCGHYHENPDNDLINLIESLSGLPFEVRFLGFEEIRDSVPDDLNVIINAGFAGSAWSGGDKWRNERLVAALTHWIHKGGVLLGVGAPSAVNGYDTFFRMAHVFGVDIDTGERINHGQWSFEVVRSEIAFEGIKPQPGIYLTNKQTRILAAADGHPLHTENSFGRGMGLYLSSYRHGPQNTRSLKQLILEACGCADTTWDCSDSRLEYAFFPHSKAVVIVNNSSSPVTAAATLHGRAIQADLAPYGMLLLDDAGGR